MRVSTSLLAMLTTLTASCQYLSGVNELVVVRSDAATEQGRHDAAPTQGLVGYWRFDENSGTTAYNSAGDHNHGKITGATWAPGFIGSALRFDGIDDCVDMDARASLPLGGAALTIEAWVNPDLISGQHRLISHISMTYYFQIDANNFLDVYFYETSMQDYLKMSGAFPLNTWTFVAVTYDGAYVTLFKNAEHVSSPTTHPMADRPNEHFDVGGGCGNERPFSGLIDEVRVYDRALSEAEVLADYNRR